MSDPYVYEGTNVLRNVLDIKNQESLNEFENTIVNLQLIRILKTNISINNSSDIFSIHKMLFKEIYDWAGLPRSLNIEKKEIVLNGLSVPYSNYNTINMDIRVVDKEYFNKNWDKMTHTALIYNLSRYISLIWRIHPFREGNTRTITTYLYLFLKQNGYDINTELLSKHSKYFRNALVLASLDEYSEWEHIENILSDAIKSKEMITTKIQNNDLKYKKIKGIDLAEYKYNYHQTRKSND